MNETNEAYAKVKQLRNMIEGCDLSQKGREDEAFLLRFLRAKKFDVDKAFKMMSKYYWMKEHSSELFHVSPVSDLKLMLEMQIQCMLPQKDNHGRQVYLFRVGMWTIDFDEQQSQFLNLFLWLQRNVIRTMCRSIMYSVAMS